MGKTAFNQFLSNVKNKTYPNRIIERSRRKLAKKVYDLSPAIAFRLSSREALVECAKGFHRILEIGPFCNPLLEGHNVRYLDVLSKEALEDGAKALGLERTEAPYIDYVSPYGDLSIINVKFDAIVSSHNLEHQPDLIFHLQQIDQILEERGKYLLIIPDKRYCFDHFLPETTIADVLQAYHERRKVHALASLIKSSALATHNHPTRHWRGDHADANYYSGVPSRVKDAVDKYKSSNGNYIDCHAWQFTPNSFRVIITQLREMGMIDLTIDSLYKTQKNSVEFVSILARN